MIIEVKIGNLSIGNKFFLDRFLKEEYRVVAKKFRKVYIEKIGGLSLPANKIVYIDTEKFKCNTCLNVKNIKMFLLDGFLYKPQKILDESRFVCKSLLGFTSYSVPLFQIEKLIKNQAIIDLTPLKPSKKTIRYIESVNRNNFIVNSRGSTLSEIISNYAENYKKNSDGFDSFSMYCGSGLSQKINQYLDVMKSAYELLESINDEAFKNGVTTPSGDLDKGQVYASKCMERISLILKKDRVK